MERKDRYVTKITRIDEDGVELATEELPAYVLIKKQKLKSTYEKHNTIINWAYIYRQSRQLTFEFQDARRGIQLLQNTPGGNEEEGAKS